jgi:tRNA threonylcarbamoyladenosine biosynthesis protein TsaB
MILSIETATDVCGVALVQKQNVIAQRVLAEKYVHSEKLLPMIDEVLRDASLSAKHLDAIAVSIGPGSFTGLRIGLSTAKGLALSLGISVIAVPTLDALAYAFFRTKRGASAAVVCPMIDAKRDEAFFCFYRIDAAGVSRQSEYAIALKSKIVEMAPPSVMFVGDGAGKMGASQEFDTSRLFNPSIVCSAESVGLVAESAGVKLSPEELSRLEPLYLREFVATQPGGDRAISPHRASILQEQRPGGTRSPFRFNPFGKG